MRRAAPPNLPGVGIERHFLSGRRRHTRCLSDWSSDVCSSDLQRPTWIVPVVLIMIAALAVSMTMAQRIGWDRIVRHGMEASSRAQQMTPEQREQGVAMGVKIASIMGYVGIIFVPVVYVIMEIGRA